MLIPWLPLLHTEGVEVEAKETEGGGTTRGKEMPGGGGKGEGEEEMGGPTGNPCPSNPRPPLTGTPVLDFKRRPLPKEPKERGGWETWELTVALALADKADGPLPDIIDGPVCIWMKASWNVSRDQFPHTEQALEKSQPEQERHFE